MPQFLLPVLVALLFGALGCDKKPDPVLASFVNEDLAKTNQIVFYTSGRFAHFGADEEGRLRKSPYMTGTFTAGSSNFVVSIKKGVFDSSHMPTGIVYRIVRHEGTEYLFDERGDELRKFEETKDVRALRHAWRRQGG